MAHIARKLITKPKNKPLWVDISCRYTDERECLTAFLAFQTAEVLEGIKPSTLINLADCRRRCGRNFYELWREHGASIVHNSMLEAKVMAVRPGSLLLLIYDRAALTRLLAGYGPIECLAFSCKEQNALQDLIIAYLMKKKFNTN
ncbi:MAG: hypothetical protein H6Q52_2001 [Deltaproteobacteria bacterium]|nr:hypothetical protein [Deltaproteobacteria bacterium]